MDFKQIRITPLHLWIMAFQIVTGVLFYLVLHPFNEVLAQGAMMGILAPIAVSSTVVAVILGANMATMVTYTILYNLALAFVAPVCFSLIRFGEAVPFWTSFWIIIKRVFPLIVFPMILAFFFQKVLPRATSFIVRRRMVPFYLWAVTLTTVIGQTIDYIIRQDTSRMWIIFVLAAIAAIECVLQFAFGRWIGGKYGDKIAGGQACGQKNSVLAVWMSQSYLDPLSSVTPAVYSIFQNLWNSWQIFRLNKKNKQK
jgi:bile acid:Na+ symporter, BASS family